MSFTVSSFSQKEIYRPQEGASAASEEKKTGSSVGESNTPTTFMVDRQIYETEMARAETFGKEFRTDERVYLSFAGLQERSLTRALSYTAYTGTPYQYLPEDVRQYGDSDFIKSLTGSSKTHPRFPNATVLNLSGARFPNTLTALQYVPNLKGLILGSMPLCGGEFIDLNHVPKLEMLDASNQKNLEDLDISTLFIFCPLLKTLKLNSSSISDSTMLMFENVEHLSRLELANTPITNEGIDNLAKNLASYLTFLRIDDCDEIEYTDEALFRLFPSLTQLQRNGRTIEKQTSIPLEFCTQTA